jgi:peptide/nickel transport system ATP-binding protein
MAALLDIKNLVTSFKNEDRNFVAVNNISFSVQQGETLAIVGESGSGKSVTSLSVMRLLNPSTSSIQGGVFYHKNGENVDLLGLTEKQMQTYRGKEISMIFQEPMTSLNPVIKCGEQVAEAIRQHLHFNRQDAREKTIELFKKVKLPRPESMYNAYPHQLSGGQKQRIMIAMAISCQPSLLIADEPTTALDVTVQKSILELLKELQEELNMGMIFITHDLGVVSEIAHQVAIMYQGKIVETGKLQEIFFNPQHPYTKGLLACRPNPNVRLKSLPTIADFMQDHEDGGASRVNSLKNQKESPEERKKRHDALYLQPPLLSLKNLHKTYTIQSSFWGFRSEHVHALNDINLSLYPGETLGLVGESGSGKSTLGKTILRLIDPNSGEIRYRDQNIHDLSAKEMRKLRKQIQIIFQDPYSSLNPVQRIGDAITEPMEVHRLYASKKARKNAGLELLEKVGLQPEHFNRYPHEFSGGQRQRIVIARAISVQPEFIICDECVSALDVSVQAQIINLLQQLKREQGLSYIFISHDLSIVKYISDRIAVMKDGKIEEIGEADELCKNPQSLYTRQLINAIPQLTSI